MPSIGLSHTATVVAEQLVIAVNACREMKHDPEFYQQCLQQSWEWTLVALNPEARRHNAIKPGAKKRKKAVAARARKTNT